MKDPVLRRKVEEHRRTFDANNIRDFTDSLLKASTDVDLWKDTGVECVTNDHLEMILIDILVAGHFLS